MKKRMVGGKEEKHRKIQIKRLTLRESLHIMKLEKKPNFHEVIKILFFG